MKDELGAKIVIGFISWIKRTCSYLVDDYGEDKKTKRHQKSVPLKNKLELKIVRTV